MTGDLPIPFETEPTPIGVQKLNLEGYHPLIASKETTAVLFVVAGGRAIPGERQLVNRRSKRSSLVNKADPQLILIFAPEAGALPDRATLRTKKTLGFCFFVSHSSSLKQGTKWQKKTSLEQSVPE